MKKLLPMLALLAHALTTVAAPYPDKPVRIVVPYSPRGTPQEVINRLHDGSVAALQSKELRERYAADGVKAIGSAPEFLTRYIQTERVKWAEVVKRSGATVE